MQTTALYNATRGAFQLFAEAQIEVLQALLFAPRHSSSAGQLCTLLSLPHVVQVNGAIGQAGRKIFKQLGAHPDGLEEGSFQWWTVLATGEHSKSGGFIWTLRPDVAFALLDCGLVESGLRAADEIELTLKLVEGAHKTVLVNAYERNPVARARCLLHYGLVCAACGINFGKVYGSVAEGFIHVHHLRILSSISKEYEVDPIQDLRPVCPNCHAVIHMADPPFTIGQVSEFLSVIRGGP